LSIFKWVAKFPEFINDGFEALEVHVDGSIALRHVPKLGVEAVDVGFDVVLKDLVMRCPNIGSGDGVPINEIENFGGYLRIDRLDNGKIIFNPLGIMVAGDSIGGNMGAKIASPKMNIKDMATMIVVVGGEIERDRDERTDISNCVSEGYLWDSHWEGGGHWREEGGVEK
jgi:hypothetical protein